MKIENYKEIVASRIKFDEHVRNSIIYPVILDFEQRFHDVPIRISVGKDGELEYAKYEEQKRHLGQSWVKNDQTLHISEALRVINSYRGWIPNKVNGKYQETNKIVTIFFHYHKKLVLESDIILNPDKRPKCLDNSWRTVRTIQGKNGCDGIGRVLAIVNQDGIPEELEIYNVSGKTNARIVEGDFITLGKWSPAMFKGRSVKSQINLLIYT